MNKPRTKDELQDDMEKMFLQVMLHSSELRLYFKHAEQNGVDETTVLKAIVVGCYFMIEDFKVLFNELVANIESPELMERFQKAYDEYLKRRTEQLHDWERQVLQDVHNRDTILRKG